MKLNIIKVNPVENMTIFVMDKLDPLIHMAVANKLMEYGNAHGEQVGFVVDPITDEGKALKTMRLQMMGGEFCGNAARSLAALMVHLQLPGINKLEENYDVAIEVSGSNELLTCTVKPTDKEYSYLSRIKMPLPKQVSNSSIMFNNEEIHYTRVDFDGITHFIVENNEIDDKDQFFKAIKEKTDKELLDAIGIMFYDYASGFLRPLVYVRATNSLYWERSCASGTSALGVALAIKKNSNIHEYIEQPGGKLEVIVELLDSKVKSLYLDGKVQIVFEGKAYIDDNFYEYS